MRLSTLTLAFLLSTAMPAAAQFTTVQRAHEAVLSGVRLPASESGTLAFKPCRACDWQTVRVNSDTLWLVNKRPLTLADFRRAVESVTDRDRKSVTVKHHLENNVITKVAITIR